MSEELQRYLLIAAKVFLGIAAAVAAYLLIVNFLIYLLPFILAWLLSVLLQPITRVLQQILHLPRGLAAALALLTFIAAFIALIIAIFTRIFKELTNLTTNLPIYATEARTAVEQSVARWEIFLGELPDDLSTVINNNIENLANSLGQAFSTLATGLLSFISSFPNLIIFLLVTVIAAFFITKDKEMILSFVFKQLPPGWRKKGSIIKSDLITALFGYIRAQLILVSIVISITFIGLLFLKAEYALLLALLVGFVDILPVLGSGSVLMPWALWNIFVERNLFFGVGLIVIYATILVMRQTLEPRIVGQNIGVYPLVTLAAIYLGLKTIGVVGIVLGPLIVITLKAFQKAGILPAWKK